MKIRTHDVDVFDLIVYQGTRIDIPTTLVTIAGTVVVFCTPLMLDFVSWNDRSKKKKTGNGYSTGCPNVM